MAECGGARSGQAPQGGRVGDSSTFHLYAMTGIIEKPYTTVLEPFPKLKDGIRHGVESRIRFEHNLELQFVEHLGNVLGVVGRILQRGRVLIRRMPND